MKLSGQDRSNLARFGCTLLPKSALVCIAWGQKRLDAAASANILVRLIKTEWATGTLLCLAFEISCSRALAHYCFFPFDLRNKEHRRYISGLLNVKKIHLSFLADAGEVKRVYEIHPHQWGGVTALCAKVLADSQELPLGYNFDKTVEEFEQRTRLIDYFQYVITDAEFRRVISTAREQASKVNVERRVEAEKLADELVP